MHHLQFITFSCLILVQLNGVTSVPGPDAQNVFNEDAILSVNPSMAHQETRVPRKYEVPQPASQRGQSPKDLVSDIRCRKTPTVETLTAFLHMPEGYSSGPVLETTPVAESNQCLITRTNSDSIFTLNLSRMEGCGVRECREQGEIWMCVTIRFPILAGLKMPEDEVIDIKCKPQDPAVAGNNIINFQENLVEQRSPAIYIGGGQEFLSEIGLFRKLPGTEIFASRVKSGSTIELGENVQLRSIVRSGDGWNFAKITDVIVHRVHDGKALSSPRDTAQLVFSDGCRNPSYRVLAQKNPRRDPANGLINNFDFRVFMFQDMDNEDSIMISAKVVACVEEIDCAPVQCNQDPDRGYGKRRKRSVNNTSHLDQSLSKVKGWEENLELKIRMGQDLIYDKEGSNDPFRHGGPLGLGRPVDESECKMYLIITLSVALTFCILSATVVLVACIRRYQENKASERLKEMAIGQEKNSIVDNLHQTSNPDDDGGFIKDPNHHSMPYFYMQKPVKGQTNTNRPVTVRSVKRRDKAKVEEKNNRMVHGPLTTKQFQHQSQTLNGVTSEERAIMV